MRLREFVGIGSMNKVKSMQIKDENYIKIAINLTEKCKIVLVFMLIIFYGDLLIYLNFEKGVSG